MNDYIVALHYNREINTEMQFNISSWIFVSYILTDIGWQGFPKSRRDIVKTKFRTGTRNGGISHSTITLDYDMFSFLRDNVEPDQSCCWASKRNCSGRGYVSSMARL